MKKLLLFMATMVAFCAVPRLAKAQNVQMHYDFGRHIYSKDAPARPRLTTTVEMFRRYGLRWEWHTRCLLGDCS